MSEEGHFATTNILVVGTGGQGVMTATEILAEAAIALGHDVKKTEVAGMAQRGGVVSSHLRFGRKVLSPQVTPGSADVVLGFEAAEAMRWRHMLRPGGLVLMNSGRLVPPIVELGLYAYPADPVGEIRAAGTHVVSFDASAIALELGDIRLGNTVMLGAISDHLPFPAEVLERCILQRFASKKPALVELNRKAFAAGRQAAEEAEKAAAPA
ncbi:MAG TPA: indolepyruvate oxidoreductase subunit beta [Accumulibacter sp.]|uniref:indolepyruvate oxidoreductase subunit beta n=1 Tax=Accumulibacter sp. TaxID=2053492 RepID=UPI002636B9A7|nr:indolepyruvate oxidoreductase subunit beta [Accumulibacter sp.]MDS4055596.1 indolepyruvate oxidoreductase subunit beta [Accumulibacter sp.]HMV05860.1 indolepyruvate oxidoreductase subunit beta [Accumulibacter sp.]HMW63167.1 indolepyruvate oxidoreductase subunit beta [Accumulibacter sp.]HMW79648.1 indolepyruvate oxidoreductase subunit beta [Accumulibacter sp.]HMX69522.1 indolepyruvate oxidoreductase subunit beta [Accumulibacter sp.]